MRGIAPYIPHRGLRHQAPDAFAEGSQKSESQKLKVKILSNNFFFKSEKKILCVKYFNMIQNQVISIRNELTCHFESENL